MAWKRQIDTVLAKDQLQALQATLKSAGADVFMAVFFWILTKKADIVINAMASRLIPFRLNRIQREVFRDIAKNNLIGKPRQSGFTTFLLLFRLFLPAIVEGGIGSLLIAQTGPYASEFFRIIQRAYRLIGAQDPFDDTQNALCQSLKANLLHHTFSNRKELVFDYLDSKIRVESAEVEEAGQGLTIHHLVADEYARWPNNPEATLANARGSLVMGGTVDKSSTANGMGGPYYIDVMKALNTPLMSDSRLFFFPHWWSEDYYINEYELLDGSKIDLSNATDKQISECLADMTEDELKMISRVHRELKDIAFVKAA